MTSCFRSGGLFVIALALAPLFATVTSTPAGAETLTFDQPETVGIAGFRPMWDVSVPLSEDGAILYDDSVIKDKHPTAVWAPSQRGDKPGALAFDALQRRLLVRFPGAAEQIANKLAQGFEIEKVELVLPFRDAELWPPHGRDGTDPEFAGYTARRNWNVDKMYRRSQPTWHAVAYALRRPWSATPAELAPTWNAFINGVAYWTRFGAQNVQQDRFPQQFGPTPVNHEQPDGRMDVTAVVTDDLFGLTLGERLRVLADQGFLVRKWETYDHRFFADAYEWATATGGRGILIRTPKLVVTLRRGAAQQVQLPPAANIPQLAQELKANGFGGEPTAVMMTEAELFAFNERAQARPEWMPEWMHQRVQELHALRDLERDPSKPQIEQALFLDMLLPDYMTYALYAERRQGPDGKMRQYPAGPYRRYEAWVDLLIGRQPRGWAGFEAASEMAEWYEFGEALPGPAQEAIRTYWTAWLMPDRPTADSHAKRMDPNYVEGPLVHPMADVLAGKKLAPHQGVHDTYWEKTGDWRGNKSFYRSGFNYTISTQNFNTAASAGALLGGSIIGADLAIEDGRHGFRGFPLGLWSWPNGSSQEHIDHYYYSHTVSGNKAVYDYAPTFYDKMLGRSVMTYNLEELTGAFHPGLRRFIAPASRTTLEHMLVATDGIQFVLHTLSRKGTIFDYTKPQHVPEKMSLIGHDVPPELVAVQTRAQPWAPLWVSHAIDDKPLPFYAQHKNGNQWRTAYFGQHYGVASVATAMPRIQVMAHWRRDNEPVDQTQDLGTFDVRYGYNQTRFASTAGGHLHRHGSTVVGQHKNKLIVAGSPFKLWANEKGVGMPGSGKPEEIRSLQTSIALFNYQEPKTWEIYVDGQRVPSLPVEIRQGQVIAIRDGVSYLGIIPLRAADLGRTVEVRIEPGEPQISAHGNTTIEPAIVIHNYNYHRNDPLTAGDNMDRIDRAYGGFVIELGDETEHGSFDRFLRHMQSSTVREEFNPENNVFAVRYTSGGETLELSRPTVHKDEVNAVSPGDVQFRVNGENPYPTDGVTRDTNVAQMARGGYATKAGATILAEKGPTVYIQHEPVTKTYRLMAPLAWSTLFAAELPDGRRFQTDGKVDLFDLITREGDPNIELWAVGKNGRKWDALANVLAIRGGNAAPVVQLNGEPIEVQSTTIDGEQTWLVPLDRGVPIPPVEEITERLAALKRFPEARHSPGLNRMQLQELLWLGPLPGGPDVVDQDLPPEQQIKAGGVDLEATYPAITGERVTWRRERGWNSTMGGPRGNEQVIRPNQYAIFRRTDQPMTVYAYARIVARKPTTVRLNVHFKGSHAHVKAWLNERQIADHRNLKFSRNVRLEEGLNELLLRYTQLRPGDLGFDFNMGTATFNLPFVEDVYYQTSGGLIPVNPTPDDRRVIWEKQGTQAIIEPRK